MEEMMIYKLKIDNGFKRLIPPLSPEEFHQLEENLIKDGCREPLCVWDNTILDGHNRYEICTQHQIPFTIQHMHVNNREAAIAWICANQLGRRNITNETRKYLIGKRYEMEKIIGSRNVAGINQHSKKVVRYKMLTKPTLHETVCRTRERLGEEYRISSGTVCKYNLYANALDSLSKTAPEILPKILSGALKISHENIVEMSQLSGKDAQYLNQLVSDDTVKFVRYSDLRKILPKRYDSSTKSSLPFPSGSVKDMPIYDPDAELSSLALTVPSWVRLIDRARTLTNLGEITDHARYKLINELLGLKETIDSMLTAIKEEEI